MALLIDKTIEIFPGVTIPQAYLRLEYSVNRYGKALSCNIVSYSSRESYSQEKNGGPKSSISSSRELPGFLEFSYDSSIDGLDILVVLHDKVKTSLSTEVLETVALRDPSTGQILTDPSTGDVLTEEVVKIPKFAMDSSISVVDL